MSGYFQGTMTSPIVESGVVLPSNHPPIVGAEVSLGRAFGEVRMGGIAASLLGVPDSPSWMAGIGFGLGSAALITAAWFFPPRIPYVSGVTKAVLLGASAYFAYRSALHFVRMGGKSRTEKKWEGVTLTPVERIEGQPYRAAIQKPEDGSSIYYVPFYTDMKGIPVDVVFSHMGHGEPVLTLSVRAVMKPTAEGEDWEKKSDTVPVTLVQGGPVVVERFNLEHPGVGKIGQYVSIDIEVCADPTCGAPFRVASNAVHLQW